MTRSHRDTRLVLLALMLSAVLGTACSSASPEQQTLINFFRAARLHDNTTLANISAVSFDPGRDGFVQQFAVVSMGAEQRETRSERQSLTVKQRAMAINSLTPPGGPDVDLSAMTVDIISKQVTVNAQVRRPDDRIEQRTLVFTLQRGIGSQGDRTIDGRWIITGLQQPGFKQKT